VGSAQAIKHTEMCQLPGVPSRHVHVKKADVAVRRRSSNICQFLSFTGKLNSGQGHERGATDVINTDKSNGGL
jgi:hypothetical protein